MALIYYAKVKEQNKQLSYKYIQQQILAYPKKFEKIKQIFKTKFNASPKELKNLQNKFLYIINLLLENKAPEYETHTKIRDTEAIEYISKVMEQTF